MECTYLYKPNLVSFRCIFIQEGLKTDFKRFHVKIIPPTPSPSPPTTISTSTGKFMCLPAGEVFVKVLERKVSL